MSALTDRLDEWAALAEKATGGPWTAGADVWNGNYQDGPNCCSVRTQNGRGGIGPQTVAITDYDQMGDEDATFIAASRTALPAAIKALRAALALHEPLRVATSASSDPRAPITYALRCSCQPAWRGYPCPVVTAIASALEVTP